MISLIQLINCIIESAVLKTVTQSTVASPTEKVWCFPQAHLLECAIHRVLSFHDQIKKHKLGEFELFVILSNDGFYVNALNSLTCAFCDKNFTTPTNNWSRTYVGEFSAAHKTESPTCGRSNEKNVTFDAEKCVNFNYESHRLVSFLKILPEWTAPVAVIGLAKSGFHYAGPEDNVRCNFCRLQVRGWEKEDTPEGEHKRWNPRCEFLHSSRVGNVAIGEEVVNSNRNVPTAEGYLHTRHSDKIYDGAVEVFLKGRSIPQSSLGIYNTKHKKYPMFTSVERRIYSYAEWPKSLKQTPKEMAEAGFFYTGDGDRVCCFSCGLGLKDWDPNDDPFVEHAKWRLTCDFLTVTKGYDFAFNIVHKKHTASGGVVPDSVSVTEETSTNLCSECKTNEISAVNLPCGHMHFCFECCKENSICKVCDIEVLAKIKPFI